MSKLNTLLAAISASFLLVGCKPEKVEPKPKTDEKETTESVETTTTNTASEFDLSKKVAAPMLPGKSGAFAPALSKLKEKEVDLAVLGETEKCAECHSEIVGEWQDSVHAFSSFNNPYYRVSFDEFVDKSGHEKAAFCGACHDPMLTFDRSINQPVVADNKAAHLGVTCNTCHGIVDATTDGNGSYTLSTASVPYPEEGDDVSLAEHKKRLGSTALRSEAFCVSCHKGFLSPETGHGAVIAGLNEYAPWRGSGYNKNPTTRVDQVEAQTCVDCHMPTTPTGHKSHRFPGGHSTLAAAIGSDAQLAEIRKLIEGAATIHVAGVTVDEKMKKGGTFDGEGEMNFDVVVHNKNVGHRFPGGALDLRDTWIEVSVVNGAGEIIAEAGLEHEKTGRDNTALRLKATLASPEGDIVDEHRVDSFRTVIFNRTLGTRDARVARYTWKVPKGTKTAGVIVKAKLRHRRLDRGLFEKTCGAVESDRGASFRAASNTFLKRDVNPCEVQPVIDIASTEVSVSPASLPLKLTWWQHYVHALGLLHQLQESLDESHAALDAAKEKLGDKGAKLDHGRISFLRGMILARQGKLQEAMDLFAEAEGFVGDQPSIDLARGKANQRTFHNEEAVPFFAKAARLKKDDRSYRALAISAGSAMNPRLAYAAAQEGLKIEPRDTDLLRSQMLALTKLDVPDDWKAKARAAFLEYKRDEQQAQIRDKCAANDEICRRERLPIPVYELRTR